MIRTIQTITSNMSKSQDLSWWGLCLPLAKVTCTSLMAPSMLKRTQRFWNIRLQDDIFSSHSYAYFNKTMQNHVLLTLQRHGCISWRCGAGLTCLQSQPFSNRECVAHFKMIVEVDSKKENSRSIMLVNNKSSLLVLFWKNKTKQKIRW